MYEFAGFGAAVVIGASWMLRFIMARLAKLEDDYRKMVENHLVHSTQAMVDMKNVAQQMLDELRSRGRG